MRIVNKVKNTNEEKMRNLGQHQINYSEFL